MNKFFVPAIACMAVWGCHSGSVAGSGADSGAGAAALSNGAYTVSGTLRGVDSGMAILYYSRDGVTHHDSATLSSGHFNFTGTTDRPNSASIALAELGGNSLSFFLEPNTAIVVDGSADSLGSSRVTGGQVETEYLRYRGEIGKFDSRQHALDSMAEAAEGDKAATDSLAMASGRLFLARQTWIKQYIGSHRASYVSALGMEEVYANDPDVREFDSVYHLLDTAVLRSAIGRQLAGMLAAAKRTTVGQQAPDFTANGPDGKPVTLSAYAKGRVVLLDFWASWCAPCRAENPNVVRAYRQYQAKGFTVLGVSLDNTREPWVKAMQKDGLDWGQVSDLKGWSSPVAALYGIRAIPMNFLLDRNGRIVAKGLRGAALQRELALTLR